MGTAGGRDTVKGQQSRRGFGGRKSTTRMPQKALAKEPFENRKGETISLCRIVFSCPKPPITKKGTHRGGGKFAAGKAVAGGGKFGEGGPE